MDVGMATAQRCSVCGKRFWMERKPKTACPKCGGALLETEERRLGLTGAEHYISKPIHDPDLFLAEVRHILPLPA